MNSFIYSPPKKPFLNILFEDEYLMVVDKPSGLLSVPGRLPEHQDSIILRIRQSCPEAQAVHRLDMDTSGIMVIAKNPQIAGILGKQFIEKNVKKIYLARVLGKIAIKGQENAPLRCDIEHRPLQIVDFVQGKTALTLYERLSFDEESSLVKLIPYTGRSHQLRVHMAYLNHPILGDRFYGNTKAQTLSPRLCLHACLLQITHPLTKKQMLFTSLADFAKNINPHVWIS